MQFREKSGQSLTEPVSVAEFKTYIGYTATDQDSYFADLITSVRRWVEKYTSLSCISKTYEVFFEREDSISGWFDLPIVPYKAMVSVQIDGTDITYDQLGLTLVQIYPYTSIGYKGVNVEYTVDASDDIKILKDCIYTICAATFQHKAGGDMVITKDVRRKLDSVKLPAI